MKFKILDLFCGAGGFSLGMDENIKIYLDNVYTKINELKKIMYW